MSDKRYKSRVQGSWASGVKPRPLQRNTEAFQPSTPRSPAQLMFQEPSQAARQKPPDIFIDKEGYHVLTPEVDGHVCSVQLYPDFFEEEDDRASIFQTLLDSIPWQTKCIVIHGQSVPMPRLVAWYGPLPYTFAGATLPPEPQWPPVVQYLHDRIARATGNEFNSVLLNLYRNGKDSVAWHSDDELLMGVNPLIASLSFGDTRMFEMRQRLTDSAMDDYAYVQHVRVPLKDGSLLVMGGETQTYWQHRVPKEYHDRKPRINLTFRTVFLK